MSPETNFEGQMSVGTYDVETDTLWSLYPLKHWRVPVPSSRIQTDPSVAMPKRSGVASAKMNISLGSAELSPSAGTNPKNEKFASLSQKTHCRPSAPRRRTDVGIDTQTGKRIRAELELCVSNEFFANRTATAAEGRTAEERRVWNVVHRLRAPT